MDQRVINTVESLIHNTTGRIRDVQSNLIPFYNKGFSQVDTYRMYNTPYMAENDNQTIIRINDLKFKNTATPQKYRGVFKYPMQELYDNNIIHPFLLFLNGKFIKWSNIEIVSDVHYSYIIATGPNYSSVEKIDIIQIPFNIKYTEDGYDQASMLDSDIIFQFDDDGLLSDIGNTYIYYDYQNSDIHLDRFDAPSGDIKGWDITNIRNDIKLFPENFIIFKDSILHSEADIFIDPMNVVTIDNGEAGGMIDGRVFYSKSTNAPKNNVQQFHGEQYISDTLHAIHNYDAEVPYYITKLREDFNFDFSKDKSYEQNILDSVNYIYNYNPQLLYPAYSSPIVIRSWTGKQINELADENNNLVMLREKYNGHDTYIIPFLNGEIYPYHSQIIYNLSTFTLPVPEGLQDDDILEFIYFRNIDNHVITGQVTKDNPLVSLDGYINKEDLLIYSDSHHDMKFPTIGTNSKLAYKIDYNWDEETKTMSFDDDYYYGRDLTFVSKNRFVYIGYTLRQRCFKFKLSDEFKYCDNQKQFMVFINGRKLSQNEFNITILKNTRPFDDLYIYTAKVLNPGDKLDVFYVPYPLEGLYMYKSSDFNTVKVKTSKDTYVYDIPVPYKSFIEEGGTFVVSSGDKNIVIDESSYTINTENNTIIFNDESIIPDTLIFNMQYAHGKGLDESGYVYINKDKLPAPFCKELYMVFVNGKKIPNDHIYNISSDCVRIKTDIQSTYNVSVMMYRDIITDLVGLMNTNTASIDQLVNSLTTDELDHINSTYNTITDVEDHFVVESDKISIINEIVRDFWMKPGINTGVPFLYDYDTDAFVQKDSGDNWIIPTMDATQFINIIEEEEDYVVEDLELPNPSNDPYYDKITFKEE